MPYMAGTAFVEIVPSLRGMNAAIRSQLGSALAGTGTKTGKQIGSNITSGTAGAMAAESARLRKSARSMAQSIMVTVPALGRMRDGFRDSRAAASAFSGVAGSIGGRMRRMSDVVAGAGRRVGNTFGRVRDGFLNSAAAASAFSGRAGTLGGRMRRTGESALVAADRVAAIGPASAKSADKVSKSTGRSSLKMRALGYAGRYAGRTIVTTLAATGAAAIYAGANLQHTEETLAGLYGSADEAHDMMGRIKKLSRNSPISTQAYSEAATQLAYMGYKGEDAITVMKNMGLAIEAVGGGSEDMQRATDAMLDMVNAGEVNLDILNRISSTGIPIFSALADEMGESIKQVREDVTNGKIKIEDVMTAIQKASGDTFKKQKKGAKEARKSLSSQFKIAADNILTSLGTISRPLVEKLAPAMGTIGRKVSTTIGKIPAALRRIKDYMDSSGLTDAFASLGRALQGVWEAAKPFLIGFLEGLVLGFTGVMRALAPLMDLLGALGRWMGRHQKTVEAIGIAVGLWATATLLLKAAMAAARLGMMLWAGAVAVFRGAMVVATIAQWALNAAVLANPYTWIVIAVLALAAAIVYLATQTQFFQNIWRGMVYAWEWTKEKAIEIWTAIKNWFIRTWNSIKTHAITIWTGLKTEFVTAWTTVKNFWVNLWRTVKNFFVRTWTSIKNWFIRTWLRIKTRAQAEWRLFKARWVILGQTMKNFFVRTWRSIKNWFIRLWTSIKNWAVRQWNSFKNFWINLWRTIKNFFVRTWRSIKNWFVRIWTSIRNWASRQWGAFKRSWARLWNAVKKKFTGVWNSIKNFFVRIWTSIKNTGVRGWNAFSSWFGKKLSSFERGFKRVWTRIKNFFHDMWQTMVNDAKTLWNKIKGVAKAPINWVIKWVINKGILAAWNKIAGFLGKDNWKLHVNPIGGHAKGGIAPGYTPGRDNQLTAVSGGEAIMRPEWTRAMGANYVHGANAAARQGGVSGAAAYHASTTGGYAKGGIIPDWGDLNPFPGAWKNVKKIIGFGKGVGEFTAHPVKATKKALKKALPGDGKLTSRWGKLAYRFGLKPINAFAQKVKGAVKSVMDSVKDTGNFVGGVLGDIAGVAAKGPSVKIGKKLAAKVGWTGGQWAALKKLWQGESGWNYKAKNSSSGAYGIPQALPASKLASAGKDWKTNPATQIKWGLTYIKKRYGSPKGALSAWMGRSPHWYDDGGLARDSGLLAKMTSSPERVLSPQQTAAFEKLVDNLSGRKGVSLAADSGQGGPFIGSVNVQLPHNVSVEDLVSSTEFRVRHATKGVHR